MGSLSERRRAGRAGARSGTSYLATTVTAVATTWVPSTPLSRWRTFSRYIGGVTCATRRSTWRGSAPSTRECAFGGGVALGNTLSSSGAREAQQGKRDPNNLTNLTLKNDFIS